MEGLGHVSQILNFWRARTLKTFVFILFLVFLYFFYTFLYFFILYLRFSTLSSKTYKNAKETYKTMPKKYKILRKSIKTLLWTKLKCTKWRVWDTCPKPNMCLNTPSFECLLNKRKTTLPSNAFCDGEESTWLVIKPQSCGTHYALTGTPDPSTPSPYPRRPHTLYTRWPRPCVTE